MEVVALVLENTCINSFNVALIESPMLSIILRFLWVYVSIVFISISCSPAYRITQAIDEKPSYNGVYVIKDDVDLNGRTISFPDGCTIVFKGGTLRNGTIVGNNTKMKYRKHCLDRIDIKGTWLVPVIKSTIFTTNDFYNIRNLSNFQNESIHNDIIISKGEYHINTNDQRTAFLLKSNTRLQLDGTLIMDPQMNENFYNGYYAIYIYGAHDVVVEGKGTIIGDLGRSGISSEYGHGICVFASENVILSGVTIKDVQGDGVVVSKNNKNVKITNMAIERYHRNGISIIDGEDIQVRRITVRNGGGTEPFAAIDVEPNECDSIYNVSIKHLYIYDCGVGIAGYVPKNAIADNIYYDDVRMSGITRCCMNSANFSHLTINNVVVENCKDDVQIMRFIGDEHLSLNKVTVDARNNKAKYPFYIDSAETVFKDCSLNCPQLFSFHLANASFVDTRFSYDSFIWTATHLTNKNLSFVSCEFDGPLFIRPDNVSFKNCVFKSGSPLKPYIVCFEEPTGDTSLESSVIMENNTFQVKSNATIESALKNTVRNSSIGKVRLKQKKM